MSESYALYHYPSCPYCALVRRFLDDAGIDIELRNIHADPQALHDLRTGGGSTTVPCLRIQRGNNVQWLYESSDIIEYLRQRRAAS
ncbi:MAG TPA: glutaredoxin [Pseudomonadales bacterium]